MSDTVLLWIDVETDGLDPDTAHLLEVSMRASTPDLTVFDSLHTVIRCLEPDGDGFTAAMHGPNGLLAECAGATAPEPAEAYAMVSRFMEGLPEDAVILPAGASVRFDRAMLDAADPTMLARCSHRSFDVSTLAAMVRMWMPAVAGRMPSKTTDHRSEHCLDDEMRLARWMKGHVWGL